MTKAGLALGPVRPGTEITQITWALRAHVCLYSRPFQECLQLARAARVPQLAEGLGLDLPDALAGDREALADLLQGVLAAVAEPEAHLDDLLLAGGEGLEERFRLLLEVDVDHG